jgi:hypothetical protein
MEDDVQAILDYARLLLFMAEATFHDDPTGGQALNRVAHDIKGHAMSLAKARCTLFAATRTAAVAELAS